MRNRIKKGLKRIILLCGIFVALLFIIQLLFRHNDSFYHVCKDEVDPFTKKYFGFDLYSRLNHYDTKFDMGAYFDKKNHPLRTRDIISLTIDKSNLNILEEQKKKMRKDGYVRDKRKKWVQGKVVLGGSEFDAKVKFHGTANMHIFSDKASYKIKLTDGFWKNATTFSLIKSEELNPTIIAPNLIANHIGLIAPYGSMKFVELNNDEKGAYCLVETVNKNWLERNYGITNYTIIKSNDDWNRKEQLYLNGHDSDLDLFHENKEMKGTSLHPSSALGVYHQLTSYINHGDIQNIKTLIDLDYFAKYQALQVLFNDCHFTSGDNFTLIYDFTRGKFFPVYRQEQGGVMPPKHMTYPRLNEILYESGLNAPNSAPMEGIGNSKNHELFKLLLADNDFRFRRDQFLNALLNKRDYIERLMEDVIKTNSKILLHGNGWKRPYYFKVLEQKSVVNTMFDHIEKYLNYHKVFVSADTTNYQLSIVHDGFTPLDLILDSSTSVTIPSITLNNHFDFDYPRTILNFKNMDSLQNTRMRFISKLTGEKLKSRYIYLNFITQYKEPVNYESALKASNIRYDIKDITIVIRKGTYVLKSDLIFPPDMSVTIEQGCSFKINEGVSIIVHGDFFAQGTASHPINFSSLTSEPFGEIAVIANPKNKIVLNYVNIKNGSGRQSDKYDFTTSLAVYGGNVSMSHCTITGSQSDDGLNCKYSRVRIENCSFYNNLADQVDLDFCSGTVSNCTFLPSQIDPNGDGLDLSGSAIEIKNCSFSSFADKGISVGEKSIVLAYNCNFEKINNAVAIKDSSIFLSMDNNHFSENKSDFALYIKKPIFGKPTLLLGGETNLYKILNTDGYVQQIEPKKMKAYFKGNYEYAFGPGILR